MSERIQVKRDGEHRGWVQYVGVDAIATDEGLHFRDEWLATREFVNRVEVPAGMMAVPMRPGTHVAHLPSTLPQFHEVTTIVGTKVLPSREEAIRWIVEEETA